MSTTTALAIQAMPWILFAITVAVVLSIVRRPWFHRHPRGLLSAGLIIATAAALVTQGVPYLFSAVDTSLSNLWFSVVLGPITASFLFESCKMRGLAIIEAEKRLVLQELEDLHAAVKNAEGELGKKSQALNNELVHLTNPYDAAASARFAKAKSDMDDALRKLSAAVGALYTNPNK